MSGLPFDLKPESALDTLSLQALDSWTGQAETILKDMPENWSDPDIDAAFEHILPVIDSAYLAYHRVRLATENHPMIIFSYVCFLGDREDVIKQGYDVMDDMPCFVSFDIRKDTPVIHVLSPIKMLKSNIFLALVQNDWSNNIVGKRANYKLSFSNADDVLSKFESDWVVEIL